MEMIGKAPDFRGSSADHFTYFTDFDLHKFISDSVIFLKTIQSQFHGRQRLTGFIMQLQGNSAAFLFLTLEQLFGKLL